MRETIKIPISIIIIPITLVKDTSSFKNFIEPSVVNKKTIVAKIGYDRERSLNDKTRSQIKKDKPYKHKPAIIKGLVATFNKLLAILDVSEPIPPVFVTPVFKRMLAVTLKATLVNRRA